MEKILDDVLKELAPEEQERARHAIWTIQQAGLFLVFEQILTREIHRLLPTGDWLSSDQTKFLAGEAVKRGILLEFTGNLEKLGIPPTERVIPRT
jgi:hypothetical protein